MALGLGDEGEDSGRLRGLYAAFWCSPWPLRGVLKWVSV